MNYRKRIFICPILYIAAMGVANVMARFVSKTQYGSPQYVEAMLPFMLIIALGTSICLYLQRNTLKEDWTDKGRYGLFLLLFLPNLGMVLFFIIKSGSFESKFLIPLVVTLFVGIAEELMFRRIVFIGLLKEMEFSKAVWISSIVFSLLHAVNVFAGLSLNSMLVQLLMTFLAGLYYSLMYWHTKNIYLMMVSHWLWDYVLLSGATTEFPAFGVAMSGLSILQLVMVLYLKFKKYKTI